MGKCCNRCNRCTRVRLWACVNTEIDAELIQCLTFWFLCPDLPVEEHVPHFAGHPLRKAAAYAAVYAESAQYFEGKVAHESVPSPPAVSRHARSSLHPPAPATHAGGF